MPLSRRRVCSALLIQLLFAGCGYDPIGEVPPPQNAATINGAAWNPDITNAKVTNTVPGQFRFNVPSQTSAGYGLDFDLIGIRGVGSYALGTTAAVGGGGVLVINNLAAAAWQTPRSGSAGTVLITELSASRMRGTFAFVATPLLGTASGTINVQNGSFDLPMAVTQDPSLAPPASISTVNITIGGTSFSPHQISTFGIGFITYNDRYQVSFIQSNAQPGTYTFNVGADSPPRLRVLRFVPPSVEAVEVWSTENAGTTGSFTITSVTPDRVIGSFQATLVRTGAGAPIVASGTFDLGRLNQ